MRAFHPPAILEQMISRAEAFIAKGEERLKAQRARVAGLSRTGPEAAQSKNLLRTMEETQVLQVAHLKVLKRELEDAMPPGCEATAGIGQASKPAASNR